MKLFDCAENSLDVEQFVLSQLEVCFKSSEEALRAREPGEKLFAITISVDPVDDK